MPQRVNIGSEDEQQRGGSESAGLKRRRPRVSTLVLTVVLLLLVGLMCGFTTNFIPSRSMEPTLKVGDHILTMRRWLAYPFGSDPARGDVIVFRVLNSRLDNGDAAAGNVPQSSAEESKYSILIKRVIAVGGDSVKVSGNTVYVNNVAIHEDHPITPVADPDSAYYEYADGEDYKVPKGSLFVLGDNRNTSDDSRFWGPLSETDVIGRYVRLLYNEGKNGPNELRDKGQ